MAPTPIVQLFMEWDDLLTQIRPTLIGRGWTPPPIEETPADPLPPPPPGPSEEPDPGADPDPSEPGAGG